MSEAEQLDVAAIQARHIPSYYYTDAGEPVSPECAWCGQDWGASGCETTQLLAALTQVQAERDRAEQMDEIERSAASQAYWNLFEHCPRRMMTLADVAGAFYRETIPLLLDLGEPEDVRVVFFFDN